MSDRNCRSWADRGLVRRWCGGRSQQDASRIRSKQFRSESTYLLLVGETGFEPATPWTRTRCLGSEADRTPMAGAVWRVGDGAAPSAGLEAACAVIAIRMGSRPLIDRDRKATEALRRQGGALHAPVPLSASLERLGHRSGPPSKIYLYREPPTKSGGQESDA